MPFIMRPSTILVILVASIFIAIFFSSCADKIKTETNDFRALDESMVNSNNVIQKQSEQVYYSLNEKLLNLSTAEYAKVWYPKAMYIKMLSAELITYIDSLKSALKKEADLKTENGIESFKENDKAAVMRLFERKAKGKELYEHLKKYKQDILSTDLEVAKELNNTMVLTSSTFDLADQKQDFTNTFFDDISTAAGLAMLSKFQNSVRLTENKLANFCHNKAFPIIDTYDLYSAIVFLSSSYVKGGEEVEVTAGVGAFSKAALPDVIINGKNIQLDVIGSAHYIFKASNDPGKHLIPVQISFIDQEGKKQTIIKNIEYTVAGQ